MITRYFARPSLVAALSAVSVVAVAAESEQPVDNIIVTAARSPVTAADVGSSVTIVNRELIDARQSVFVLDLLRDVPGLQISRSGGHGKQTQLRIRGAESNQALVMIDGVEVLDPAAADEFQWENLTTADVERIEVVRGPQSAIWGGEALAGVINIVTRKGGSGLNSSSFVEGGSFDTINAGARVSGGSDSLFGSASISYLNTDGINVARTGTEKDGYDNTTLALNGGWKATDALNFSAAVRYTDASNRIDDFDFSTTGLPTDPVPATLDARGDESQQLYAGLTTDLATFGDRWNHNLRLNMTSTERDSFIDNGEKASNVQGDVFAAYYVSTFGLTDVTTVNGPLLNVAVDWKKDKYQYRCFDTGGFNCTTFGDPNQNQDMSNVGYVAELLSGDWGGFAASASVRYDDNSDFDNETTYRIAAGYLLPTATRLRGALGTGWKAPTFTERFGFFPAQFIGNPNLEPETSTGWELGVDQALLDERLNLALTYFNEELEDEINGFVFDVDSGLATAANQPGTSERKGVEVIADATIGNSLKLLFNYTYLDATEPGMAGGTIREVRRPRHSGAFNANYRFLQDKANVNLNVSYVGARHDLFFPPFPNPMETVTLDAYTLVNLSGSYALNEKVELYGRVDNLFDEDYEDVFGFSTNGIGGFAGVRVSFAR